MSRIEARLSALGLTLPPAFTPPPGVVLPFQSVRLVGSRAIISGHGPQGPNGQMAEPLGKVGRELSVEQAYAAARLTGLSILGSLQRTIGDLDRIVAWTRIFGMVNSAPSFTRQPAVINGFYMLGRGTLSPTIAISPADSNLIVGYIPTNTLRQPIGLYTPITETGTITRAIIPNSNTHRTTARGAVKRKRTRWWNSKHPCPNIS